MIGLIPAAGEGTRLLPLTKDAAKEMLIVGDKPIIEHALDQFKAAGITKIFIIVAPGKDALKNHLGDGSALGLEIEYLIQERAEGLGRAIGEAQEVIQEPFAVVLGDTLLAPKDTLKSAIKAHEEGNADATLTLHTVEDPSRFGVAEIDGTTITSLEEKPEKPKSNLAVVGMYVFNPIVFEYIQKTEPGHHGEYQITDSLRLMLQAGKAVKFFKHEGTWFDIGTADSYAAANEFLSQS